MEEIIEQNTNRRAVADPNEVKKPKPIKDPIFKMNKKPYEWQFYADFEQMKSMNEKIRDLQDEE